MTKKKSNITDWKKNLENQLLTPEELSHRAEEYVRQTGPGDVVDTGDRLDLVAFKLEGENYVLQTDSIQEIHKAGKIFPIPNADYICLGVMNIRGNLRLVFDIKELLRLPRKAERRDDPANVTGDITATSRIIFYIDNDHSTGFIADEVSRVISVDLDKFQENMPAFHDLNREYFKGVFRVDQKNYVWLNIEGINAGVNTRLSMAGFQPEGQRPPGK
ncbi:MAG: purine-binding chemotaxis protein CheW [Deltaproteobacteria bacterium]|nr:purine-binding chemotaxis protein CheW [Deltaproteobacteria bacterium]